MTVRQHACARDQQRTGPRHPNATFLSWLFLPCFLTDIHTAHAQEDTCILAKAHRILWGLDIRTYARASGLECSTPRWEQLHSNFTEELPPANSFVGGRDRMAVPVDCGCSDASLHVVCAEEVTFLNLCYAEVFFPGGDLREGPCRGKDDIAVRTCACPRRVQPVCADGHTFENPCLAACATGTTSFFTGPCSAVDPTFPEVYQEKSCSTYSPSPVCADGVTFVNECYARSSGQPYEAQNTIPGECSRYQCDNQDPPVCMDSGETMGNVCDAVCTLGFRDFLVAWMSCEDFYNGGNHDNCNEEREGGGEGGEGSGCLTTEQINGSDGLEGEGHILQDANPRGQLTRGAVVAVVLVASVLLLLAAAVVTSRVFFDRRRQYHQMV